MFTVNPYEGEQNRRKLIRQAEQERLVREAQRNARPVASGTRKPRNGAAITRIDTMLTWVGQHMMTLGARLIARSRASAAYPADARLTTGTEVPCA